MILYRRRIYLIALVLLFFLTDHLVKEIISHTMIPGDSFPVIQNVFNITYVHNPGAAFSLFQQYPAVLLILTSVLFFVFLIYSLYKRELSLLEVYALGLILGGALGNIGDRLLIGKVIDYLDFTVIDYPIFNLADVFIFCGISLLVFYYVRQSRPNHLNAPRF